MFACITTALTATSARAAIAAAWVFAIGTYFANSLSGWYA